MRRILLSVFFVLTAASPGLAQAPAGGAGPLIGGPLVQGVCLLSQQAVFANAKVGVAATARLKQLTEQAQAGLESQQQALEAEAKSLESQRASLSQPAFDLKQQALSAKVQTLQSQAARKRCPDPTLRLPVSA